MLLAGLTSINCSWKTPEAGARACGHSSGIHTRSFQAT
uniref:Uncharacterized protein n=1 Tax=Rhizophora mucronata TaxID=61149 RepID=A0A2P2PI93_RHIMU